MSIRETVFAAMLWGAGGAVALSTAPAVSAAQDAAQVAAQHVAAGDQAVAARNLVAALAHYREAIAADSADVDALWKASNTAVDLGEFNDADRAKLYAEAEDLGRRAVKAGPSSSYAHYALAKALGRVAQTKGTMDKIKYGTAVYNESKEALRLDSLNAGALHVLGEWNAEVMRLNGFARFTAKKLLGGAVMGQASWDNAQRDLERAVALEPNRITHRLDLAAVYADRGDTAKARDEYTTILRLPDADYNDRSFKAIAQQRLAALK